MASVSTLQDTFSGSAIDRTLWNLSSAAPAVDKDPIYGRVRIAADSTSPELGTSGWDMTGSSIYARVITLPQSDGTPIVIFKIQADANNYATIQFGNNTFEAAVSNAGQIINYIFPNSYSEITDAYWRIREASGTLYFDTSPDASTWTNQVSAAYSWAATNVNVYFSAACGASTAGPLYAYVDDVNALSGIEIYPIPSTQYGYMALDLCGLVQYDTLAIQRNDPDGSQIIIRNANYVSTGQAETWSGYDLEAPLGASITYTAIGEIHHSDGTVTTSQVTSAPVTIAVTNGTGWLKDLTQSALNTRVTIQALSDVKRPARQNVYQVIGRRNPVVISDVLGGRAGTVTLMTTDPTDSASIKTLVESGDVLFLQATPADGFNDLYFAVGDVTVKRPSPDSTDPTRLWEIVFTEVDSPTGQLTSLPGNSWLLVTKFGTWQDVVNHRATWLDVLNTPYGSGTGGV